MHEWFIEPEEFIKRIDAKEKIDERNLLEYAYGVLKFTREKTEDGHKRLKALLISRGDISKSNTNAV